ncbi:hypothetical protein SAMN05892883_2229 [Jatrophihabitans sp. GAS493]|nr:hypothetical protein SAMN05892883_2229 [Jatrophihabitans sp. GAS493]
MSSCVVDAVWSIGSQYDNVTVPITRSVFVACVGAAVNPLIAPDDLTTIQRAVRHESSASGSARSVRLCDCIVPP